MRRDRNGDGQPDLWEQYKDGVLIAILYDDDFDGKVDRREEIPGAHAKVEMPTTMDPTASGTLAPGLRQRRAACAEEVVVATVVPKPWGHELIWAQTDRYVGKILHIKAGESLSLQYHRVKDETIMVLAGRLAFEHFADGETAGAARAGPARAVPHHAGLRHRMIALEDTDVVEVSTPELDDVVRLEDRYGRTT